MVDFGFLGFGAKGLGPGLDNMKNGMKGKISTIVPTGGALDMN